MADNHGPERPQQQVARSGAHGAVAAPTVERRPLWLVVVALLLGAAALWGASRLAWIDVPFGLTLRGRLSPDLTGADLVGALTPLALFALAAVAAVPALGGWPRRVLGVLLAAVGAWALYAILQGATSDVVWSGWAPGYGPSAGSPHRTFWGPGVAVTGALLIAAAGAVLVWQGHRMPRMGGKYSAPGAQRAKGDADTDFWDALSDGEDPTTRR